MAILNLKQYYIHCYVALSNVILINAYEDMYSLFNQEVSKIAGQLLGIYCCARVTVRYGYY